MKFDGHRLKALRIARKWDQHRLAESARAHGVGITQSQVSRYENGHEPSGRNALALATALGVEVRDLYVGATAEAAADEDETRAVSLDEFLRSEARRIIREEAGLALKATANADDRRLVR